MHGEGIRSSKLASLELPSALSSSPMTLPPYSLTILRMASRVSLILSTSIVMRASTSNISRGAATLPSLVEGVLFPPFAPVAPVFAAGIGAGTLEASAA